jgi:hypothetical protein
MSELEQQIISELIESEVKGISWDELSSRMDEKQEEFDQEVKEIEQLDMEAKQKSMTYFMS